VLRSYPVTPYGPPAKGHIAIAATHQSWFDEGEKNKHLALLDAGAVEDLGYCALAYSGNYAKPDGSHERHCGRSVNVLRREADSDWRIHISSMTVDES
jgi:ketosteroid isomerase-like protein